jgi:hypothetical protein
VLPGLVISPPEGNSFETGGEEGAGGGAGEEEDGENIAADPNFMRPTATGSGYNEWTNGANAYDSDGTYATAASSGLRQTYSGFDFGIPETNTIQGIVVKLDTSSINFPDASAAIDVALSWDGGSSYTTAKATPQLVNVDVVYTVGDATDTWGRSWTAANFSSELFRIRVTSAVDPGRTVRLDALEIRVFHQTGGGGAGGGGGDITRHAVSRYIHLYWNG